MVFPDAKLDPRFANNPIVWACFWVRSYAGVPPIDTDGFAAGGGADTSMPPHLPKRRSMPWMR
jgi:hypothetical protein